MAPCHEYQRASQADVTLILRSLCSCGLVFHLCVICVWYVFRCSMIVVMAKAFAVTLRNAPTSLWPNVWARHAVRVCCGTPMGL